MLKLTVYNYWRDANNTKKEKHNCFYEIIHFCVQFSTEALEGHFNLLIITYYLLLITYHLLLITYYLLLITYYLSLITYYLLLIISPGRVAQSVTCLATDVSLIADPGVASSIPARFHTFVEIDHGTISTVILLPSAESFKKGCCQLQVKLCARSTG